MIPINRNFLFAAVVACLGLLAFFIYNYRPFAPDVWSVAQMIRSDYLQKVQQAFEVNSDNELSAKIAASQLPNDRAFIDFLRQKQVTVVKWGLESDEFVLVFKCNGRVFILSRNGEVALDATR